VNSLQARISIQNKYSGDFKMSESSITVNTNSKLFNGTVLALSTGIAVFASFNATYYAKITKATPDDVAADTVGGVKRSSAQGMMIFSVIVALFCCLVSVWCVYRMIFDAKARKLISSEASQLGKRAVNNISNYAQGDAGFVSGFRRNPNVMVASPLESM
jgi:hypothetical protein